MREETKRKFKKKIEKILRFYTQKILDKYKPDIVGITGSVGKTSTKEAIYAVLAHKFSARRNIKNYNNEIGIPLTVINRESGVSTFLWLRNFLHATSLWLLTNKYPGKLILEVGVDRPGDIRYLARFVPFKVGVVTAIGPTHLEFFGTIDKIAKEKGTLIKVLPKNGIAILNRDDKRAWDLRRLTYAQIISYGFSKDADVWADVDIHEFKKGTSSFKGEALGITFKLNYKGSTIPVRLPNIIGGHQVYAALAAAAVGIAFGMNLVEIAEGLKGFSVPRGRMGLIPGIKDTLIIDDTYNAAPASAIAALQVLSNLEARRRIAVLGDMLELGPYTEEGHRRVGRKVAEVADILITVGARANFILDEALKQNFSKENVFRFDKSERAGRLLQSLMKPGDLILIKGSQGIRMEKIVKEVMAEPDKAKELLVRQDSTWLKE